MGYLTMGYKQQLAGLAIVATAASVSVPTLAATQTWNFNSGTQSFTGGATAGNSLDMNVDGIQLTITGWADTNDIAGPDTIESARLHWAMTNGLGILDRDEISTGATGSPNHSVDSFLVGGDSDGDFNMLLLTFSEAVNLTGIDLGWATGGNAANTADMSLLAYTGNGSSALNGQTWANVLGGANTNYDSVGNPSNVGLSYFTVNPGNITSTRWLVGVYNPVFGAGGDFADDGIKLTSLTTSTEPPPDRDVPVPGTLVLLLAGLAALRARRPMKAARS
jgi:hypothetical protein